MYDRPIKIWGEKNLDLHVWRRMGIVQFSHIIPYFPKLYGWKVLLSIFSYNFWKNYVLHRDFDLKILLRYFLTRWKKNRISSFLANLLQKFLILINVAQFFSSQILYVVHFLVDCKEPLTHICKKECTLFLQWNEI